jgi:tRNA (guanine-N7-)-methyltransferase
MSAAQTRAIDQLWPRYGVDFKAQALNIDATFHRHAPVILEIGFGMGDTTAEIAAQQAQLNFLAIDVHPPGVGNLLKQLEERQLSNVRVMQHDAVEVVQNMIAENSLSGIHIYFPDPWPKARHHKRRLIQSPFVALLTSRLAPGGYFHCATDWENYAEQMRDVLSAEPNLENTSDGFVNRPEWRPETKFERRGLNLGHGVWDLLFRRRSEKPESDHLKTDFPIQSV